VAVIATATVFSVLFNAVSQPPRRIHPGFGAYVQIGTSAVHYETWGATGTPIVLVPGFLEASTVWSAVGPLLADDHIVYALDLPGHGYTHYRGPMLLDNQAQLVDRFVHALHLDKPVLVGHSLGAAIVGRVALEHPEDTSKVVFADGDGLALDLPPRWLRALILGSPYATTALRIGSRWTALDKWFIQHTCGPRCAAPTTALTKEWVRPLHQRSDEHALRSLVVNADYGLTPRSISEISTPAAIIWGGHDRQGGSLEDAIRNLHHPPVHLVPDAGHLTMLADPKAFARAVESP
jgi:pimeloyl-ACP methyl ester carboxylesterase